MRSSDLEKRLAELRAAIGDAEIVIGEVSGMHRERFDLNAEPMPAPTAEDPGAEAWVAILQAYAIRPPAR